VLEKEDVLCVRECLQVHDGASGSLKYSVCVSAHVCVSEFREGG